MVRVVAKNKKIARHWARQSRAGKIMTRVSDTAVSEVRQYLRHSRICISVSPVDTVRETRTSGRRTTSSLPEAVLLGTPSTVDGLMQICASARVSYLLKQGRTNHRNAGKTSADRGTETTLTLTIPGFNKVVCKGFTTYAV